MLTAENLRKAASLATQIEQLQAELDMLLAGKATPAVSVPEAAAPVATGRRRRTKISAEGLARIRAAQQARWARARGEKVSSATEAPSKPAKKGARKKISAEGLERIRAAQQARWARVRAESGKEAPAAKNASAKRKISAEGLARIRAAQKARWARAKAQGKGKKG